MKRLLTLTLVFVTVIGLLFAATQTLSLAKSSVVATDSMQTANQLYEAGQFSQAAQAYQQIADQGLADSALYFNMGNAYYKQGDFGRAILNYRLAEQLAPRDADIEANLEMARARVAGEEAAVEEAGFFDNIAGFGQEYLTLNELALLALGMWVLFVALVLIVQGTRKGSLVRETVQVALVVSALLLTVSAVGLGSRLYLENSHAEGVIVATEVSVTSGPGSQYVSEFTLNNGEEVEIVESRENWVRLALPDTELQGWVPVNAIEAVSS